MNKSCETHSGSPLYDGIAFDAVLGCIHCGLCLDACPTYAELGAEQDSPRGRLYLMRALWEGALQADREVVSALDRCLDCRACETACPSLVPFGELLEKTRAALVENRKKGRALVQIKNWIFDMAFGRNWAMVLISRLAKIYQFLRIPRLIQTPLVQFLLPKKIVAAHRVMPKFEGQSFKKQFQSLKTDRACVALFSGCVMDVADHEIHQATVQLLEAAGFAVEIPHSQGCCGALHVHRGFRQSARGMAEKNRAAFQAGHYQAVIVNAAGCGAQLKEYAPLFENGSASQVEGWQEWASQVKDLLVFLASVPGFGETAFLPSSPVTVLYDAPCHLIHAQRANTLPQSFLSQLPGVHLVPLADADRCCGAGGIYNLTQPDLAQAVLKRKMADVANTLRANPDARVLLTANPGCLYQLRAGVATRKLPLLVTHPAVFLVSRLKSN